MKCRETKLFPFSNVIFDKKKCTLTVIKADPGSDSASESWSESGSRSLQANGEPAGHIISAM